MCVVSVCALFVWLCVCLCVCVCVCVCVCACVHVHTCALHEDLEMAGSFHQHCHRLEVRVPAAVLLP